MDICFLYIETDTYADIFSASNFLPLFMYYLELKKIKILLYVYVVRCIYVTGTENIDIIL